jgi:hypothetical protein
MPAKKKLVEKQGIGLPVKSHTKDSLRIQIADSWGNRDKLPTWTPDRPLVTSAVNSSIGKLPGAFALPPPAPPPQQQTAESPSEPKYKQTTHHVSVEIAEKDDVKNLWCSRLNLPLSCNGLAFGLQKFLTKNFNRMIEEVSPYK